MKPPCSICTKPGKPSQRFAGKALCPGHLGSWLKYHQGRAKLDAEWEALQLAIARQPPPKPEVVLGVMFRKWAQQAEANWALKNRPPDASDWKARFTRLFNKARHIKAAPKLTLEQYREWHDLQTTLHKLPGRFPKGQPYSLEVARAAFDELNALVPRLIALSNYGPARVDWRPEQAIPEDAYAF